MTVVKEKQAHHYSWLNLENVDHHNLLQDRSPQATAHDSYFAPPVYATPWGNSASVPSITAKHEAERPVMSMSYPSVPALAPCYSFMIAGYGPEVMGIQQELPPTRDFAPSSFAAVRYAPIYPCLSQDAYYISHSDVEVGSSQAPPKATFNDALSTNCGIGNYAFYSASLGSVYPSIANSSSTTSENYDLRTLTPPASLLLGSTPPFPPSMMRHVSSNTPLIQRKHKCKVCDRGFIRPSSLRTHMYSHTGEKPFACDVEGCERHFSVVSNLQRHMKVHKNKKTASSRKSPHNELAI